MKIDVETEQLIASIKLDLLHKTLPQDLQTHVSQECARIRISNESSLIKLQGLYELSGKVMQYVQHFIPCKKGCNHCCFYRIGVSDLEIQFIEDKTGFKHQHPIMNVKNVEPKAADEHGMPCPFLSSEGACTNYEARPYMCRRHATISLDNHWCHHERVNRLELPLICFEELDDLYEFILAECGNDVLHEIRDVFPKKSLSKRSIP